MVSRLFNRPTIKPPILGELENYSNRKEKNLLEHKMNFFLFCCMVCMVFLVTKWLVVTTKIQWFLVTSTFARSIKILLPWLEFQNVKRIPNKMKVKYFNHRFQSELLIYFRLEKWQCIKQRLKINRMLSENTSSPTPSPL